MRAFTVMFGRPAAMAASVGLSILFLSAGWAALPTWNAPSTLAYLLPDGDLAAEDETMPVFVLRPDHSTLRAGVARMRAGGRIDVTLYDPSAPELSQEGEGLLFNADLRVLWLLASDEERGALRQGLEKLGIGLRDAIDAVLRSPEFNDDYRPVLKDVGRHAIDTAWHHPGTRAAYDDLVRSAEPVLREAVGRDLRAIVMKRAEPMVWDMLSANVGSVFKLFQDQPWNLTPVEQALESIQRDVREQALVEKTTQRILDSWQAKAFLQAFAGNAMDATVRDPRMREALHHLLTDQRLGPYLAPASQPAGALARLAPQVLFGVHPQSDLNALAAYTFRSFITGRPGRLIILTNPRQRDRILALDRFAPRPLMYGVPQ